MIKDKTTTAINGLCADFIVYDYLQGGLLTLRYYFYFLIASNFFNPGAPGEAG
jgi:hypothetical protein